MSLLSNKNLSTKKMYNTYNRSEIYYLKDLYKNETYFIGNKKDLISFIAKNLSNYSKNSYNKEDSEYFYNLNMGNDYNIGTKEYRTFNEELEKFFYDYKKIKYSKRYLFFDGYYRIIDIRFFKEEIYEEKRTKEELKGYNFKFFGYSNSKKRKRQYTRSHSGNCFKGKCPRVKNAKIIDDTFKNDLDYKKYNFKPLEDSNHPYPKWYDDKSRRVEGNWKSQKKVRHQYDMHTKYKTDSRKNKYIPDFSDDEISYMLKEDFDNKKRAQ